MGASLARTMGLVLGTALATSLLTASMFRPGDARVRRVVLVDEDGTELAVLGSQVVVGPDGTETRLVGLFAPGRMRTLVRGAQEAAPGSVLVRGAHGDPLFPDFADPAGALYVVPAVAFPADRLATEGFAGRVELGADGSPRVYDTAK